MAAMLSTLQLFDATLQLSLDQINIQVPMHPQIWSFYIQQSICLAWSFWPIPIRNFLNRTEPVSCDSCCWTEARHQAHGQLEQRLTEIDAGGEGMGRGQESFEMMFCRRRKLSRPVFALQGFAWLQQDLRTKMHAFWCFVVFLQWHCWRTIHFLLRHGQT